MAISVILSRLTSPPVVSISTMAYLRSVLIHPRLHLFAFGPLISVFLYICTACSQSTIPPASVNNDIMPGAWDTEAYLPLLKGKRVGLVVNHTSTIGKTHLVDSLLSRGVNVVTL